MKLLFFVFLIICNQLLARGPSTSPIGFLVNPITTTITPETAKPWIDLASKEGLAMVISIVAMLVVLTLIGLMMLMFKKMFNLILSSNEKRENEFQKGLMNTIKELTKSITLLESKIQEISYALNFDKSMDEKLKELADRIDKFEISSRKNLFQYIKLVIEHLELKDLCINNPTHDRLKCGYPNDNPCGMMIIIRNKIKDSLTLYIIDDSVKSKIIHILDTYMLPTTPIQNALHSIRDEIEAILN